jgi:cytochrome P450
MTFAISTNVVHSASILDTLSVLREVVLPTFGKGVIVRRPSVVSLAARLDLDAKAIRRLQLLRDKYGSGPLILRVPLRRHAVILDPDDVIRVLEGSPDPFSPASVEKEAALAHFEPGVSLISKGGQREDRRRFNEAVLEPGAQVHRLAATFIAVIGEEAKQLAPAGGRELGWQEFSDVFQRIVRRIVLGDAARDARALTDTLTELRRAGNWAFLRPRKKKLLASFQHALETHLARAEHGSLAGRATEVPQDPDTRAVDQVTHWLFAFDAAAMASWRALGLLAAHPEHLARASAAADRDSLTERLAHYRCAFLESLRLWPTTPAILRETTHETRWGGSVLPAGTSLLIFAPFFHRDDDRLPFANRFAPDVWLDAGKRGRWPLIPFSAGPAMCPAHDLVPLLCSALLAAMTRGRNINQVAPAPLDQRRPIPATLDHASLRLSLGPRGV